MTYDDIHSGSTRNENDDRHLRENDGLHDQSSQRTVTLAYISAKTDTPGSAISLQQLSHLFYSATKG